MEEENEIIGIFHKKTKLVSWSSIPSNGRTLYTQKHIEEDFDTTFLKNGEKVYFSINAFDKVINVYPITEENKFSLKYKFKEYFLTHV